MNNDIRKQYLEQTEEGKEINSRGNLKFALSLSTQLKTKIPQQLIKSAEDPFWGFNENTHDVPHLCNVGPFGGDLVIDTAPSELFFIQGLSDVMRPKKNSKWSSFEEPLINRLCSISDKYEAIKGANAPSLCLATNTDASLLYILGLNDDNEMNEMGIPYIALPGKEHNFFCCPVILFLQGLLAL